ncbi:hypothetical protein PVAP13_4NG033000 [Panicum virgatum]|uniref:GRF-type domain-containing protein n=1 Tax=Panicum virgatum TaxID=38727 RepID=A0A8T0T6R5_PANVG|nr:hypothetical protein PVAP13_4NG033000 [Panicum virgatum]
MSRCRLESAASRGSAPTADQGALLFGKETGFPLIRCDQCGLERVIELRSWTEKNYVRVFFRCPRNIIGAPDRCGFYFWQREYFEKLVSMGKIPVLEDAEPVSPAEDEAVSRLKAGNIATAIGVEAQLERLARTVKMLVFIVCVCVWLLPQSMCSSRNMSVCLVAIPMVEQWKLSATLSIQNDDSGFISV